MTPTDHPAALLAHLGFLRELARDLVGDAAGGDDLAQQVLVRSLENPPARGGSLHGWLTTMTRRIWSNQRREERSRRTRERSAARREHAPSTADVLAAESVRRTVVRAVLALDEPFREAVLLRYYEGLSSPQIAQRLGVPAATVRSRLARGLERLRGRLDAESGGDRSAWVGGLAPLARLPAGSQTAVSLPFAFATKKLAVLLFVASLAAVAWQAWPSPPISAPGEVASTSARTVTAGGGSMRDSGSTPLLRQDVAAVPFADSATDELPVFPAERGAGVVRGVVLDAEGMPCPGAAIEATPHLGNLPPLFRLGDDRSWVLRTTTGADGSFELRDVEEGPVMLEAKSGGLTERVVIVSSATDPRPAEYITLRDRRTRGEDVRVRVWQDSEPVPGARVELYGWSRSSEFSPRLEILPSEPFATTTTDAHGIARFEGLGIRGAVAFATTREGALGKCELQRVEDDPFGVPLAVGQGASLRGRFVGVPAELLEGAILALHALPTTHTYHAAGGRRIDVPVHAGRFEMGGLAPGPWGLFIHSPHGLRVVPDSAGAVSRRVRELGNAAWMQFVQLGTGAEQECEVEVTVGGRIEGRVVGPEGPVAHARILSVLAPRTGDLVAGNVQRGVHVWRLDHDLQSSPFNPAAFRTAVTDSEGCYVLDALPPGTHRLEVVTDGLAYDRRMEVVVEDGETIRQEHKLDRSGVLQVAALDTTHLGVARKGEHSPLLVATVRNDCATIPGLAPGRYVVQRLHSTPTVAPVPIGEVEIRAGRTTWADLSTTSVQARLQGRVRSGSEPFAGALVLRGSSPGITDSQGRFDIELGYLPRFDGMLDTFRVQRRGIVYGFKLDLQGEVAFADLDLDLGTRFVELTCDGPDGAVLPANIEFRAEVESGVDAAGGFLRYATGRSPTNVMGRARIGPLPDTELRGTVRFANGYEVPFSFSSGHEGGGWIRCPRTVPLTVRVRRGGLPAPEAGVRVLTWVSPEPPPDSESALWHQADAQWGVTDQDGNCVVAVRPRPAVLRAEPRSGRPGAWQRIEVRTPDGQDVVLELPAR